MTIVLSIINVPDSKESTIFRASSSFCLFCLKELVRDQIQSRTMKDERKRDKDELLELAR